MAQEELLKRRGMARQAADAEAGEITNHAVEVLGAHVEADPSTLGSDVAHPGELIEPQRRRGGLDGDSGVAQVTQFGQRPALDRPAGAG